MGHLSVSQPRRPARIIPLVLALVPVVSLAEPRIHVVEKKIVTIEVRSMTATPLDPPPGGVYRLVVEPDRGGGIEVDLRWPGGETTSHLELRAFEKPPQAGLDNLLGLESVLTLPDGGTMTARRDLAFTDSTTALFEVARVDGRSLTLALAAEASRESFLSARPPVGVPVRLFLEIQRLDGQSAVSLETNVLNTFVGEPVAYEFKLGERAGSEAVRVALTPTRLYDDVARIEIEVTGKLPDGDGLSVFSRKEEWMSSRGAVSILDVSVGDPPKGYRFLVTPRF